MKNETVSAKFLREAAAQGLTLPAAQFALGDYYRYGAGAARNDTEAVIWFRKAADQGDANAQYELGHSYDRGLGVRADKTKAVDWLRKAADQGNAEAKSELNAIGMSERQPGAKVVDPSKTAIAEPVQPTPYAVETPQRVMKADPPLPMSVPRATPGEEKPHGQNPVVAVRGQPEELLTNQVFTVPDLRKLVGKRLNHSYLRGAFMTVQIAGTRAHIKPYNDLPFVGAPLPSLAERDYAQGVLFLGPTDVYVTLSNTHRGLQAGRAHIFSSGDLLELISVQQDPGGHIVAKVRF
jgi:TPR repeat protein